MWVRCVVVLVISEWSPSAAIDLAAFVASILRFQTILPGFKVELSL